MANISKWSNIAVAMQSAIAAAVTISGITKASPGVATTSTSHGYSNGDYVLLTAQGMYQVDKKVVRVAGVTSTTFQLEGIDTTLFGTFSSGTCEKLTFGTTFGTLTSLSASGGDFDFIDTTTIHAQVKTQIPGLANPAKYSFESYWDVSDAGLLAAKAASETQAQRGFLFTFPNGQKAVFAGYIGCTLLPTGSSQDLVKTSVDITAFGTPTYYST